MPATLECYLCLLRQSLEAARLAVNDETIHRRVLEEGMKRVLAEGLDAPPPRIGRSIHRLIKDITRNPDPYHSEKMRFNRAMIAQIPRMRAMIEKAEDQLSIAVKLSITGNSIDAALGAIKESDIDVAFAGVAKRPLVGQFEEFRSLLNRSEKILFLTDNAGEIVCDALLIEYLTGILHKKITVAVRGVPILNDATLEDAKLCGLTQLVRVISNGNDGLGTFLNECTDEFLELFQSADLVIGKGLANYETLVENRTKWQPKQIAFLFKSKCPFIAAWTGTALGDLVVRLQ